MESLPDLQHLLIIYVLTNQAQFWQQGQGMDVYRYFCLSVCLSAWLTNRKIYPYVRLSVSLTFCLFRHLKVIIFLSICLCRYLLSCYGPLNINCCLTCTVAWIWCKLLIQWKKHASNVIGGIKQCLIWMWVGAFIVGQAHDCSDDIPLCATAVYCT